MSRPRCVAIGTGRLAGGFVAPLLSAAGWEVVLSGRNPEICTAIDTAGGLWLRRVGEAAEERWYGGIRGVPLDDSNLRQLAAGADLFATSVGPSSLQSVGRRLAPLVRARLDATQAPINIITFENHRRAPELLAAGLFEAEPLLAGFVGRRLGISGAAAWRTVSRREVAATGVRFLVNDVSDCYVDGAALLPQAAPLDGSIPGLQAVQPFDCYMAEKLWGFNGGHATAAYLGWHSGCTTIDEAMAHPDIRAAVAAVVVEAQRVLRLRHASKPDAAPLPLHPLEWILARYSDPGLRDPVTRVGREPRRKLAAGDRFIGPAVAGLAIGCPPVALAGGAAAALAYADATDVQAVDLRRELELLGPEEVLATVSMLDPHEELTAMICERYRQLASGHLVRTGPSDPSGEPRDGGRGPAPAQEGTAGVLA
jgi:mannitol-1-phosphate 5-dehydrogenase